MSAAATTMAMMIRRPAGSHGAIVMSDLLRRRIVATTAKKTTASIASNSMTTLCYLKTTNTSKIYRLGSRIASSAHLIGTTDDRIPTHMSSISSFSSTWSSGNSRYHTTRGTFAQDRLGDKEAVVDLFHQYAKERHGEFTLDPQDICELLRGIGREHCLKATRGDSIPDFQPDSILIEKLFAVADLDGNGVIDLDEFLEHAYTFIGDNPAGIILVVGGPGSGKGVLSDRLERECNVVHLSSGELLRNEVEQNTPLGKQVSSIMKRGELVSSAIMVALMKKRMKNHPGKRVLLDGFPRSLENAHDLVTICGKPELALHLVCDDTVLMERIMKRQANRDDDNFETALSRIRTYHKYHTQTLEWLRQQHIPIVQLDCEGTPESVWKQLVAIGKLMRPAVKLPTSVKSLSPSSSEDNGYDSILHNLASSSSEDKRNDSIFPSSASA